jgi:hypothetical protein
MTTDRLRELTERIRLIRDNSSDGGDFTDGQLEELSHLATELAELTHRTVQRLMDECDRLRDGPRSMIESDYTYYQAPKMVPPSPGMAVHIQAMDGEGRAHFALFNCVAYRVQEHALSGGDTYVSLELVTEKKERYLPSSLSHLLPDSSKVKQRLRNGLRGVE